MKTTNPFSRFRSRPASSARTVFRTSTQTTIDRKLVQHARVSYLPTWKQLTYVGRFLSSFEKKFVRLLLGIIMATALLSGVGYVYQNTETVPARGGEYSEGFIGQPKFLNPLFSSTNEIDSDIVALLYSGLFTYNEKREIVPDLAERHTISDDHKIYDITLATGRRWSDGEPVTIDDVLFTFETILNPETGSPLAASFQGVKIEKLNTSTIRFTLKQPFAPFIHTLTTGIIPEHIWGSIENPAHIRLAKTNLEPVGSGAWRFDRLVKREGGGIEAISLKPNPLYPGPQPYIDKFTLRFFPDQTSLADAFAARHIMATSFPPRDSASSAIRTNNLRTYPIELPQYTALFFNTDPNSPLKDKTLRLALTAAIDKNSILSKVLKNNGTIIHTPFVPGMIGYSSMFSAVTTTLDEANNLLDKTWNRIQPEEYFATRRTELAKERGYIDQKTKKVSTTPELEASIIADIQKEMSPTQTFYRRTKKDQTLRLTITTVDTPEYQQVGELIAAAWQNLGVQTTVKTISRQFFLRNVIKNRDYETVLYGEILGGDPDPFPFWHSSQINYPGLNLSLYSNRTVDTLLENARATTARQDRADLYLKFQHVLLSDIPAVFLYTPRYELIAGNDVRNISIPPLVLPSQRYANSAQWYVQTRWKWKK